MGAALADPEFKGVELAIQRWYKETLTEAIKNGFKGGGTVCQYDP